MPCGASISTPARRCSRCISATCVGSSARPVTRIRSRPCATSATGCTPPVRRLTLRVGLRAELATAIALVTAVAVGATFLALYSGTGSRLRAQLDSQLRTQAAEWQQSTAGADLSTPKALERVARRFLAAQ